MEVLIAATVESIHKGETEVENPYTIDLNNGMLTFRGGRAE
jgi:hypothetical protein